MSYNHYYNQCLGIYVIVAVMRVSKTAEYDREGAAGGSSCRKRLNLPLSPV